MAERDALSPEMKRVLDHAIENGGVLVRYPGGYWTHRNCEWAGTAPAWYVGTTTIEALVKRGRLTYSKWQPSRRGEFPIEVSAPPPPSSDPKGESNG